MTLTLRTSKWTDWLCRLTAEALVLGLIWVGFDAFAHLRLGNAGLVWVLVCWIGLLFASEAGAKLTQRVDPFWSGVGVFFPPLLLVWIDPALRAPLTFAQLLAAVIVTAGARYCWRSWRIPTDTSVPAELARRCIVAGCGVWAVAAFFTDQSNGGTDARWYMNMVRDYIEQGRAGVFPVFVGQGEFAFNGGVHPFRSAPLFMALAGLWDVVTFRSLPAYSVLHLTAVTVAIASAISSYASLVTLMPGRRWAAVVCAAAYVFSPAILSPLYDADMYMTFTACLALPVIFAGNVVLALGKNGLSRWMLPAGLALAWMSHPPTALAATVASVFLQVIGWMEIPQRTGERIRNAVLCGAGFAGFSLYYFASMSELPPRPGAPFGRDLVWLVGIALLLVSAPKAVSARHRAASAAVALALVLVGLSNRPWLVWSCLFVVMLALLVWLWRRLVPSRAILTLPLVVLAAIVAASAAWHACHWLHFSPEPSGLRLLDSYAEHFGSFFAPITGKTSISDCQLSWAVCAFAVLALGVGMRRSTAAFILGAVALGGSLLVFRLPGCSDFVVGYAPPALAAITNLPLALRILPGVVACSVVAGFLAMAGIQSRRTRAVVLAGVALLVLWSAFEVRRFADRSYRSRMAGGLSQRKALSENSPLYRFAYDLLPIPDYFTNGVADPRLEVRFLGSDKSVRIGPREIAQAMEGVGSREVNLETKVFKDEPDWLVLEPELTVGPNRRELWRFEFTSDVNYPGYLILQNKPGDYREYSLPESGMPLAFGSAPRASRILSFWNSGDDAAVYRLTHYKQPGCSLEPGRGYARLTISEYDPDRAPIRVDRLIPSLRAHVRADQPGFLETPRVYLPGYHATVDGKATPVMRSPQKLAMVPIPAGEHDVDLRFVGSARLWVCGVISAVCWSALGLAVLRERRRNRSVRL